MAGSLFLVLYGVTAAYFSGVMVRLMLVLAPAVCCLAGVAVSDTLATLSGSLKAAVAESLAQLRGTSRNSGGSDDGALSTAQRQTHMA